MKYRLKSQGVGVGSTKPTTVKFKVTKSTPSVDSEQPVVIVF